MPWSLETMYEIWDDKTGEKIEIGPDRDGLDLIEIRWRDSDQKITSRMTFAPEVVPHVVKALQRALMNATEMKNGDDTR